MLFRSFRGLSSAPSTRFGVSILYGVELNILDETGSLDLPDDILSTLDFAAAGIHFPYFSKKSSVAVTSAYLHAIQHPFVHIITHCDDPRFPADIAAIPDPLPENCCAGAPFTDIRFCWAATVTDAIR